MASVQDQYTEEMYKKFGYYAAWNPGVPFKLGDIGRLKNRIFTRTGNLESLGIPIQIREDKTKTTLEHYSHGGVSVSTKLAGKAAPPGSVFGDVDAGIIVEFSKENATLFKANNTFSPSIEDAITLGKEILKRYENGDWDKDLVIITELVEAETATILISNEANTKVELKAQANIHAAHFDIADAGFNFGTDFKGGLESKIVAEEGLTPLFKIMGIHRRIFQPSIFKSYSEFPVYPENFEEADNKNKEVPVFDYFTEGENN